MIDEQKLKKAHEMVKGIIPRTRWEDLSVEEKKKMIENKNRLVWWGHQWQRKKLNKVENG